MHIGLLAHNIQYFLSIHALRHQLLISLCESLKCEQRQQKKKTQLCRKFPSMFITDLYVYKPLPLKIQRETIIKSANRILLFCILFQKLKPITYDTRYYSSMGRVRIRDVCGNSVRPPDECFISPDVLSMHVNAFQQSFSISEILQYYHLVSLLAYWQNEATAWVQLNLRSASNKLKGVYAICAMWFICKKMDT